MRSSLSIALCSREGHAQLAGNAGGGDERIGRQQIDNPQEFMRRGFNGLSGLVQSMLDKSLLSRQVVIFRGRRGDLVTHHSLI